VLRSSVYFLAIGGRVPGVGIAAGAVLRRIGGLQHEKGLVAGARQRTKRHGFSASIFPIRDLRHNTRCLAKVSEVQAMTAEGFGTAVLVFLIFALTDPRNRNRPTGRCSLPSSA